MRGVPGKSAVDRGNNLGVLKCDSDDDNDDDDDDNDEAIIGEGGTDVK